MISRAHSLVVAVVFLTVLLSCSARRIPPALPDVTLDSVTVLRVQRSLRVAIRDDTTSALLNPASNYCLAFRDTLGREFFDREHQRDWPLLRPIHPMPTCPRTYASMVYRVDSSGRALDPPPAGYVDPHRITVMLPREEGSQWTIALEVARGMATWRIKCVGSDTASVRCETTEFRVSFRSGITGVAAAGGAVVRAEALAGLASTARFCLIRRS
jgi:hypothetical protein